MELHTQPFFFSPNATCRSGFEKNVKDTHTEEYGFLDLFASFQPHCIHQAYGFHQACRQNVANKAYVWVSPACVQLRAVCGLN